MLKLIFFLAINMLNKVQSRQTAGISTLLRGVFKSTQDCFINAAWSVKITGRNYCEILR